MRALKLGKNDTNNRSIFLIPAILANCAASPAHLFNTNSKKLYTIKNPGYYCNEYASF